MSATNRGGLVRHEHDFYETPEEAVDVVLDVLGIDATYDGYVVDPGTGTGIIANRVAARAPKADVRGIELVPDILEQARASRAATVAWELGDWLSWQPDGPVDLVIGNSPYQKTHFDPDKLPVLRWTKKPGEHTRRSGDYLIAPSCAAKYELFFKGEELGAFDKLSSAKLAAAQHSPNRGGVVIDDEHYAEKFIRKAFQVVGKKGTVAMLLRYSFLVPKTRRALRAEFGKPNIHALERRPSFNGSGTDATDYAWFVWGPKSAGRWDVIQMPSAR